MKSILLTLLAVPFLAVSVHAEDKPAAAPGAKPEKPKMDPAAAFAKLDTNGDKSVSLDEMKAGPMGKKDPAKAEEMFKKKDKDADGKLSLDEFSAKPEKKPKKDK